MAKVPTVPNEEEMLAALEMRHTKKVQDKIRAASVAVCGLGGLGSHIAFSLARCGIGKLHLIDFDRVDLTNLNRQQYNIAQLGQPKPEALAEEIRAFAPYVEIQTDFVEITPENVGALLINDPYICEAFDDAEQKAMLTNCVLEQFPEKYLVGASGMAGYGFSNEIQTRKVMKHYYLCGDGVREITQDYGLMAPRVMICAGHQANQILKLIISGEE